MRFGTWNLAGRWDARHHDMLQSMDCDVLLLTEVSERVELAGYVMHLGMQLMTSGRRWAAVASRQPMTPEPDPHGASALARVGNWRVCSSVLPWRSCGTREPWRGATTAEKTAVAVAAVKEASPTVWGGDWNHALSGREWAGSMAGRAHLLGAIKRLNLQVPTGGAPHQLEGLLSIDHLAVPESWSVDAVVRHRALVGHDRISDHDAYALDVTSAG